MHLVVAVAHVRRAGVILLVLLLELHLVLLLLRQRLKMLVVLLQAIKRAGPLGLFGHFLVLAVCKLERILVLTYLWLLVLAAVTAQLLHLVHDARVVLLDLVDLRLYSLLILITGHDCGIFCHIALL
jgi:hypothetical protein